MVQAVLTARKRLFSSGTKNAASAPSDVHSPAAVTIPNASPTFCSVEVPALAIRDSAAQERVLTPDRLSGLPVSAAAPR